MKIREQVFWKELAGGRIFNCLMTGLSKQSITNPQYLIIIQQSSIPWQLVLIAKLSRQSIQHNNSGFLTMEAKTVCLVWTDTKGQSRKAFLNIESWALHFSLPPNDILRLNYERLGKSGLRCMAARKDLGTFQAEEDFWTFKGPLGLIGSNPRLLFVFFTFQGRTFGSMANERPNSAYHLNSKPSGF